MSSEPSPPLAQASTPTPGAKPDGNPRLTQFLKILTEIASLLALITALLVYFGWRRTQEQANGLGSDASVFGLTTQDYVMRSVDIVLIPSVLALLVILLGLWAHRRLVASPHVGAVGNALRFSWLSLLLVSVPLLVLRPGVGVFWLPFVFSFAVFGTWYGLSLRATSHPEPQGSALGVVVTLGALAAVSLFWMTERIAQVGGEARIEQVKADVEGELPSVTVFSAQRLNLDGAGVSETALFDPEAAYRFRYEGLHLFQQSAGKHFLMTADWSPGNGRLIVLPDDATIRLEFGPGS